MVSIDCSNFFFFSLECVLTYLSVLATITGLAYCLISLVLFPNAAVIGSSAWVFSFMAYYTYLESLNTPTTYISSNFMIPTWSKPFLVLFVTAIIMPGSSFLGHLLGIGSGFLFASGRIAFLIEPPTKIVLWIEGKLAPLIALIPKKVKYIKEVDAIELRKNAGSANVPLPLHELGAQTAASVAPARRESVFKGHGNVLGSEPGASTEVSK